MRSRLRDRWFALAAGIGVSFAGAGWLYLLLSGPRNADDLTGVALLGAMGIALTMGLLILFMNSSDL